MNGDEDKDIGNDDSTDKDNDKNDRISEIKMIVITTTKMTTATWATDMMHKS